MVTLSTAGLGVVIQYITELAEVILSTHILVAGIERTYDLHTVTCRTAHLDATRRSLYHVLVAMRTSRVGTVVGGVVKDGSLELAATLRTMVGFGAETGRPVIGIVKSRRHCLGALTNKGHWVDEAIQRGHWVDEATQ